MIVLFWCVVTVQFAVSHWSFHLVQELYEMIQYHKARKFQLNQSLNKSEKNQTKVSNPHCDKKKEFHKDVVEISVCQWLYVSINISWSSKACMSQLWTVSRLFSSCITAEKEAGIINICLHLYVPTRSDIFRKKLFIWYKWRISFLFYVVFFCLLIVEKSLTLPLAHPIQSKTIFSGAKMA